METLKFLVSITGYEYLGKLPYERLLMAKKRIHTYIYLECLDFASLSRNKMPYYLEFEVTATSY